MTKKTLAKTLSWMSVAATLALVGCNQDRVNNDANGANQGPPGCGEMGCPADMAPATEDMGPAEDMKDEADQAPEVDMPGPTEDMGLDERWRHVHEERGWPSDDIWHDEDGDGYYDREDNCPYQANPEQEDADSDGIGDVCDNCQQTANQAQADTGSFEVGIGDACASEPKGEVCREEETLFNLAVPNIYFALDSSGSMRGAPLEQAIDGLSTIADRLAGQIRAGFGAFPIGNTCGTALRTFLPMGNHQSIKIQASYQTIFADGATPTASVFETIREQDLISAPCAPDDPSSTPRCDPQDDRRIKVVVLITDGYPTVCGTVADTEREIRRLADEGVRTYVVGFNLTAGSPVLNRLAEAGATDASQGAGGDRYFLAENSEDLVEVINRIRDEIVGCTYDLVGEAPAPSKVWVKIDDEFVPRDSYEYRTEPTPELELEEGFCSEVRRREQLPDTLTIVSGCDETCDPSAFWGCCREAGESCEQDADCCKGRCREDGQCVEPCRPSGISCTENSQCCDDSCATQAGSAEGVCLAG